MTNEERITKMAELRAFVETAVKDYNAAMSEAKFDIASRKDKEMGEKVNEYTGIARDLCFEECAAEDDPMVAAVKRLTFTTIGVKDKKKEGLEIPVREVIEKERQIDLAKLNKYVDGGIGADPNWLYAVEKMNLLMTVEKAKELGIDPTGINDSYAMSELGRQFDMGKNPVSKTNLLKTLTRVIQAMIGGEYKPTSHDVNYLLSIYSRKSRKALTVTCANHRYMRGYLMEICHRIITDGTYSVEYKQQKR